MYVVYILKCSDNTFYTGYTDSIDKRLIRHQKGYVDSTKLKLPVELIFYCAFKEQKTALQFRSISNQAQGLRSETNT
jgi:putative endonuclease